MIVRIVLAVAVPWAGANLRLSDQVLQIQGGGGGCRRSCYCQIPSRLNATGTAVRPIRGRLWSLRSLWGQIIQVAILQRLWNRTSLGGLIVVGAAVIIIVVVVGSSVLRFSCLSRLGTVVARR